MLVIRQILCPTDFSEFSHRALEHAIAIARWYKSKISVQHVFSSIPPPGVPDYPVLVSLSPEMRESILAQLQLFSEPARKAGIAVEAVLDDGHPVNEIVKRAKEAPADLVVLGTHGRGGFEKLMLGSVTEQVLRKVLCPVLTVPSSAGALSGPEPGVFKTILCPVDFSEASMKALEYAFSLAKEADAKLLLLHALEVLPDEELPETLRFDTIRYNDNLKSVARDRLLKLIPVGASDWSRPEVFVAVGKAYREILKTAEERQAGLIVIGIHGRNPIDRLFFGSTTQHVVRQATCPVLTICIH
jgi:nucleotide-binding universal stress UspA family protein